MKSRQSIFLTILLSIGNISHATPAQDKTVEELFKVTDIKTTTLNNLQDKDLKDLGLDKEAFWREFEPEIIKIYSSNLTEEELQATIQYYKNPEVQSLLKKMPEISKLSERITMRILLKHVLDRSSKTK